MAPSGAGETGDAREREEEGTPESGQCHGRGGREVEKRAESSRKPGRTLEEILERINEVSTQVNQGAEEAATASRPADRSGRGAAEPRQPFQAVVRRDYT